MAHEVESLAYVGMTPWHTLGNKLQPGLTLEEWQREAGLDWKIREEPMYLGNGKQVPDVKALVRDSDNKVIATAGSRFVPVQNDAMFEFFKEYTDRAEATMEIAGSLRGGRDVWCLAKIDAGFTVFGVDPVDTYLLLANSHAPGHTLRVMLTSVRVCCANTMALADRQDGHKAIRFYHSRKFTVREAEQIKERMGISRQQIEHFKHQAEVLARFKLTEKLALDTVINVLGNQEARLDDQPRVVTKVMDLFEGGAIGSNLKSSKETAWGLLNAVTEYIDHHAGRGPDTRMASAWFGNGANQKQKMFNQLIKLAA